MVICLISVNAQSDDLEKIDQRIAKSSKSAMDVSDGMGID